MLTNEFHTVYIPTHSTDIEAYMCIYSIFSVDVAYLKHIPSMYSMHVPINNFHLLDISVYYVNLKYPYQVIIHVVKLVKCKNQACAFVC